MKVVYGLKLGDGPIRYIGQTRRGAHSRLIQHRTRANAGQNQPVYDWMRKHGPCSIQVEVLQECESLEELHQAEAEWINRFRSEGRSLLNLTDGGEGVCGRAYTEEQRQAVSDRLRGRNLSDARRAAISASLKGRIVSAETREKISAALAGRPALRGAQSHNYGRIRTAEHREKLRLAMTGKKYTPERLAAHIETRPRGEAVNTARLNEGDVLDILSRLAAGEQVSVIAAEYGVHRKTIGRIKAGTAWSHIPRTAMNGGEKAA